MLMHAVVWVSCRRDACRHGPEVLESHLESGTGISTPALRKCREGVCGGRGRGGAESLAPQHIGGYSDHFNILIAPWVLGGAHRPYMFVFTGEGGDLW